jgi:hypothetical protein
MLKDAENKLETLRAANERQQEMVRAIVKQRDMYRALLAQQPTTTTTTTTSSSLSRDVCIRDFFLVVLLVCCVCVCVLLVPLLRVTLVNAVRRVFVHVCAP